MLAGSKARCTGRGLHAEVRRPYNGACTTRLPQRRGAPTRVYEEQVIDNPLNNPLFTDQFKSVLQEALTRTQDPPEQSQQPSYNGSATYTPAAYNGSGVGETSTYSTIEGRVTPQEEMLLTALGSSRKALQQWQAMAADIELAIKREKVQVERLEFALEKARSDAAYYATIESLARRSNGGPSSSGY